MTHHEDHEDAEREEAVAVGGASRDAELEQAEDGRPSADSPNPTQAAIDEDPESSKMVDVGWEGNAPDA